MPEVICQRWESVQPEWGVRPEGYSLHRTEEELEQYTQEYGKRLRIAYGDTAPPGWERPHGEPYACAVDAETYALLSTRRYGLRIYDNHYPSEDEA